MNFLNKNMHDLVGLLKLDWITIFIKPSQFRLCHIGSIARLTRSERDLNELTTMTITHCTQKRDILAWTFLTNHI